MIKHRTIIIPASVQPNARALCKGLAGIAGDGMFVTGLSATGQAPATHYVSAGIISTEMAALLPCKTVTTAKLPEGERQQAQITLGAVWTGATVNNVCVIVAIATVGAFAPACLILGVAAGVQQWGASAAEREFWGLCARERVQVPDLICTFV